MRFQVSTKCCEKSIAKYTGFRGKTQTKRIDCVCVPQRDTNCALRLRKTISYTAISRLRRRPKPLRTRQYWLQTNDMTAGSCRFHRQLGLAQGRWFLQSSYQFSYPRSQGKTVDFRPINRHISESYTEDIYIVSGLSGLTALRVPWHRALYCVCF